MAKPRVFISSTYYDLRQYRLELDKFIESLGYEPVRNEEGDIPYKKDINLRDNCLKEISNCDILVCLIGGEYGTEYANNYSVTQTELKNAIEKNKQVYIFIDKSVDTEYYTYLQNKNNDNVNYYFAKDSKIFSFIEEIRSLKGNNVIHTFESADDIKIFLKEQFAGLFKQYIQKEEESAKRELLVDIQETASILHSLVDYLKESNKEKQDDIIKMLIVNHPLTLNLKKRMSIQFKFYVESINDLNALFSIYSMVQTELEDGYFVWINDNVNYRLKISISMSIFDNGKLRYMKHEDWKDEYLIYDYQKYNYEDLPF